MAQSFCHDQFSWRICLSMTAWCCSSSHIHIQLLWMCHLFGLLELRELQAGKLSCTWPLVHSCSEFPSSGFHVCNILQRSATWGVSLSAKAGQVGRVQKSYEKLSCLTIRACKSSLSVCNSLGSCGMLWLQHSNMANWAWSWGRALVTVPLVHTGWRKSFSATESTEISGTQYHDYTFLVNKMPRHPETWRRTLGWTCIVHPNIFETSKI